MLNPVIPDVCNRESRKRKQFPMKRSPTTTRTLHVLRPLMILTATAFLCCVTMYLGLFLPAQHRLSDAHDTLHALRQQHVSRQTAKTTQQALTRLWKDIPTQQKFTHLGVKLNTLAQKNGVTIPEMNYHVEPSKKQTAPKGSITFQAFGAYDAIRRFIYQVEKTSPYLMIEKLTAERSRKTEGVAFTLQIGTFFRSPSAQRTGKEHLS